ncbi:hypothetical protein [Duganella radicis]|uniref:Protein kinase domain-containing protein n=1 Tax=Duganella radicis TaxID=551988 RepID=A0A6L6PL38_9BURK|nr:hypothetical protein [Duganella radicis]MTV39321.1 hypothetical protein [Duganella radicis]
MLDINEFKDNLIGYECVRVRDTQTIWLNDTSHDALAELPGPGSPAANFTRHFSFAPSANRCFTEAELDHDERRVYQAERYGGGGVGVNGGGGRVGNLGRFQVKGVGPNPVTGSGAVWHSYGSLNLVDAAYEAIYSSVLAPLLPLGCAKVHGLIRTSATGAYHAAQAGAGAATLSPTAGAFLVREQTLRPAHFMHAERFALARPTTLKQEPQRVRAVHRQLKSKFASPNHFVQFIGKFILSCCKQFAFARAARIAHGGVTPSNLCLDGRWIDLTEARFLSGGQNFRGTPSFYDEPQVIAEVVTQLVHVFGKSNQTQFNPAPLLRYFQSAYSGCFAYYALVVMGLPDAGLEALAESEDGKAYTQAYASVVLRGKQPRVELPAQPDPADPVIAFMRLSYLSLAAPSACVAPAGVLLRCQPAQAQAALTAFHKLFHLSLARAADAPGTAGGLDAFRFGGIACAIKALRWACLSAYFYRDRITSHLYYLTTDRPDELGAFIQQCIDQSRWIFDRACAGEVVILDNATVRVVFDQAQGRYRVSGASTAAFDRYRDCLAFLRDRYPRLRLAGDFDPAFYLDGIAEPVTALEQMTALPAAATPLEA